MALKSFKKLLADAKQRDSYWVEKAKLDFSVALNIDYLKKAACPKKRLPKNWIPVQPISPKYFAAMLILLSKR